MNHRKIEDGGYDDAACESKMNLGEYYDLTMFRFQIYMNHRHVFVTFAYKLLISSPFPVTPFLTSI